MTSKGEKQNKKKSFALFGGVWVLGQDGDTGTPQSWSPGTLGHPRGTLGHPRAEQTHPGMCPCGQPYKNNPLGAGANTKPSGSGGSGAAAATKISSILWDEPGAIPKNHGRPWNHHPLHRVRRGEEKNPNPLIFFLLWEAPEQEHGASSQSSSRSLEKPWDLSLLTPLEEMAVTPAGSSSGKQLTSC